MFKAQLLTDFSKMWRPTKHTSSPTRPAPFTWHMEIKEKHTNKWKKEVTRLGCGLLAVVVILGAPSNQLSTISRLSLPLFVLYAYRWKRNFKRKRKGQNLRLRKMDQTSRHPLTLWTTLCSTLNSVAPSV